MNQDLCKEVKIIGTKASLCDEKELLDIVSQTIDDRRKIMVLSGNIHSFNLCYKTPWLRDFFNGSDIVRIDGAGIRLGAAILGYATPPRMTWADFGWNLAEVAAKKGFRLFLLGAEPGVAKEAAEKLRERFPGLEIAGVNHGYFTKELGHPENKAVIERINREKPDILMVGFGMPLQERWIKENYANLSSHVIFTVGAAFDYISGKLDRAPSWMTRIGFEWLGRLLIEPGRLWRRYIIGNPSFLLRVIGQKFGIIRD
jgi:N-acetylglucosaminyldiphosphoundecaprenol N-acetyl-beta-D-mannosaminyltransferase